MKTSEDQRRPAKQCDARASSHCLWGSPYILSKHHSPSEAFAPAKHHMPSYVSVSIKHSLTRQLPEKHHMTQPSHFCISGKLLRLLFYISNLCLLLAYHDENHSEFGLQEKKQIKIKVFKRKKILYVTYHFLSFLTRHLGCIESHTTLTHKIDLNSSWTTGFLFFFSFLFLFFFFSATFLPFGEQKVKLLTYFKTTPVLK